MTFSKTIERIKLNWAFYRRAVNIYKIHSPQAYQLIDQLLLTKSQYYAFQEIESERKLLLKNHNQVLFEDLGAGGNSGKRKVSEIARTSLSPASQGELMFRLVNRFKPRVMIELGTSLGISSAYLMAAKKESTLYTLEGNRNLLEIAEGIWNKLGLKNIHALPGSFKDTLPGLCSQLQDVGLVYLDGHHDEEATWEYVNLLLPCMAANGVIVLDDILWSEGMYKVWKKIIHADFCAMSLEIRDLGIVFLDKNLSSQHVSWLPYAWKPWQLGLFM